jgi:hypothetical protein
MLRADVVREGTSVLHRRPYLLLAAALALATAPAARAADAPAKAWDQAAVSALAAQLAKAADELYEEYYRTPGSGGGQLGSGQSRDAYQLK